MSTQYIPNREKQIIQSNVGDYNGNLWSTFNIDLDSNPGTIKTSKRLTRVLDTASEAWDATQIVQALQIHDGRYYVATNEDLMSCSATDDPTDENNWTDVSTIGTDDLGLETDMASFNGLLLVSLGTDILSWDGSTKNNDWWTTVAGGTALTASKTHTMAVLRTGTDTLFVTDGNLIRYYNTAASGTIITLDTLMTANTLTPSLDRMWAGTYTEVENNAYVYEIQVGNAQANQSYEVDGRVCLTMFTYKNTPYVITERGYIQGFNGAGFQTVAQFPWADQSKVMEGCRPGLVQDSPTSRAIHPKGAQVSGKYAFIYVNADDEYTANNLTPRGASGVWVLDLGTYSLTHRYSLTNETTDTGVHEVDRSGPLLITNTPETRIMVGGSADNYEGVWMEGTETARGYFTTVRHESESIADAFENAYTKADTLEDDASIEVKYKDAVKPDLPLQVNNVSWLEPNKFTTTADLSLIVPETDGDTTVYGYEVEIINQAHAGQLCQIVNIEGATTKTVTVDTTFATLGEFSDILIDNWKRIEPPTDTDTGEYSKVGESKVSPFRQHKVVMTGDVTLRQFISKSNSKVEL